MEENNSLSRRQWFGKITVPALAAGATMVGLEAGASPNDTGKEDKRGVMVILFFCLP